MKFQLLFCYLIYTSHLFLHIILLLFNLNMFSLVQQGSVKYDWMAELWRLFVYRKYSVWDTFGIYFTT